MIKNKRGNVAFIVIASLLAIFVIGGVYVLMTQAFNTIYDKTIDNITDPDQLATGQKIKTVWVNWPLVAILGVFLGGLVLILRQSNQPPAVY